MLGGEGATLQPFVASQHPPACLVWGFGSGRQRRCKYAIVLAAHLEAGAGRRPPDARWLGFCSRVTWFRALNQRILTGICSAAAEGLKVLGAVVDMERVHSLTEWAADKSLKMPWAGF